VRKPAPCFAVVELCRPALSDQNADLVSRKHTASVVKAKAPDYCPMPLRY
jgi:hypothetical protein